MDGNVSDPASHWRQLTCERIARFRCGECDFDGLLMYLTLLARLEEQGTARLRPPVHAALRDFLVAAEPYAAARDAPPRGAFDGELMALHAAIRSQAD